MITHPRSDFLWDVVKRTTSPRRVKANRAKALGWAILGTPPDSLDGDFWGLRHYVAPKSRTNSRHLEAEDAVAGHQAILRSITKDVFQHSRRYFYKYLFQDHNRYILNMDFQRYKTNIHYLHKNRMDLFQTSTSPPSNNKVNCSASGSISSLSNGVPLKKQYISFM